MVHRVEWQRSEEISSRITVLMFIFIINSLCKPSSEYFEYGTYTFKNWENSNSELKNYVISSTSKSFKKEKSKMMYFLVEYCASTVFGLIEEMT